MQYGVFQNYYVLMFVVNFMGNILKRSRMENPLKYYIINK